MKLISILLASAGFGLTACSGGSNPCAANCANPLGDFVLPTISLQASSNVMFEPGTLNLFATAHDNVGLSKVEFYDNDNKIGELTKAPFTFAVAIAEAQKGQHEYTAKAFDTSNNVNKASVKFLADLVVGQLPSAPTNLVATAISDISVKLSWVAATNAVVGVERRRDTEPNFILIKPATWGTPQEYQDDTAEPSANYVYRIRGINASGASDYVQTTSVSTAAIKNHFSVNSVNPLAFVVAKGANANASIVVNEDFPFRGTFSLTPSSLPFGIGISASFASVSFDLTINVSAAAKPGLYTIPLLVSSPRSLPRSLDLILEIPGSEIAKETFDSGIPSGWVATNAGGSVNWRANSTTTNLGDPTLAAPFSGTFLIANSSRDGADPVSRTAQLTTSNIDAGNCANLVLEFSNYFLHFRADQAQVELSVDGGNTFAPVLTVATDNYVNTKRIVLESAANQTAVKIRFSYSYIYDYHWAIDNFRVLCF